MSCPRGPDLQFSVREDQQKIPSTPGVVVLRAADERVVIAASTGDLQGFVTRRLAAADPSKRQTDLSSIVDRIDVWRAGSMFEAEWLYLEVGRAVLPETYRAVTTSWRAWFAHVDPDGATPRWTKTHLGDQPDDRPGAYVGPFPDKDSAGRFIEAVIDTYDLCRSERTLALAPNAEACAYKEMGRCPAPCDGSEPMEEYRRRTREAIAGCGTPPNERAAPYEREMQDAANSHDYERAGEIKKQIERLASLNKRAFRFLDTLDNFRWFIAAPSTESKQIRLFLCDRGTIRVLGDVGNKPGDDELSEVTASASKSVPARPLADLAEYAGLLSRYLFLGEKRRTCRFLKWRRDASSPSVEDLTRLVRAAGSRSSRDEHHDTEVGE